ncbi:MAG: hypothetical protein WCR21_13665 [Bacteroidota bacterium]
MVVCIGNQLSDFSVQKNKQLKTIPAFSFREIQIISIFNKIKYQEAPAIEWKALCNKIKNAVAARRGLARTEAIAKATAAHRHFILLASLE